MTLNLLYDYLSAVAALVTALHPKESAFPWPTFIPTAIAAFAAVIAAYNGRIAAIVAKGQLEVAKAQRRTAEDKLRLDLFERRYKVYDAIKQFMIEVRASGNTPDQAFYKFIRETLEADFLFNPEIPTYIGEIIRKVTDSRAADASADSCPIGTELYAEQKLLAMKCRHSLEDEYNRITELFHPYLGFSHLKQIAS